MSEATTTKKTSAAAPAKPEVQTADKMTLATKITLSRIFIIPVIIFLYLAGGPSGLFPDVAFIRDYAKLIALLLFGIAAMTDWLDGYVARKRNEVSAVGKMLDPIADKILTVAGFLLIATDVDIITSGFTANSVNASFGFGFLPIWFAVVVLFVALGRDYIINGLRAVAAGKGVTIAADKYGKAKSLLQYISIGLLMIYAFCSGIDLELFRNGTFLDIYQFVAIFGLALATVLSIYSAVNYMYKYRETYLGKREPKKSWEEKTKGDKK